jgi:hypothetical protein
MKQPRYRALFHEYVILLVIRAAALCNTYNFLLSTYRLLYIVAKMLNWLEKIQISRCFELQGDLFFHIFHLSTLFRLNNLDLTILKSKQYFPLRSMSD